MTSNDSPGSPPRHPNTDDDALVLPAEIANRIDELHSDTIYLSVPLHRDVIQIGTSGTHPTATLEVHKTPSAVAVRRTDDRPIQAQILHRGSDDAVVRPRIFTEPGHQLKLQRLLQSPGPRLWIVTVGGAVHHRSDLIQLVRTIVSVAVDKQRRGCGDTTNSHRRAG